ncbi:hypothetical protein DPMN_090760 [Dreissena polymorpha]|uniref:Uncharacterized protein n=1 Tax=Dreissena polymorpha TaxID=45954 RepID=A0A9D4QYL8_DREPO|nr:hypothetical protein DPMN_090757 [Dreissena polymorpha]KAH3848399.1 hypothetical protein DPMN_090760 [Dreissena polymorpha]
MVITQDCHSFPRRSSRRLTQGKLGPELKTSSRQPPDCILGQNGLVNPVSTKLLPVLTSPHS